jgi:hypothetical protein
VLKSAGWLGRTIDRNELSTGKAILERRFREHIMGQAGRDRTGYLQPAKSDMSLGSLQSHSAFPSMENLDDGHHICCLLMMAVI